MLVGGRVAGLVDAGVDAATHVLHEGAEEPPGHRREGEGGVENEAGCGHGGLLGIEDRDRCERYNDVTLLCNAVARVMSSCVRNGRAWLTSTHVVPAHRSCQVLSLTITSYGRVIVSGARSGSAIRRTSRSMAVRASSDLSEPTVVSAGAKYAASQMSS